MGLERFGPQRLRLTRKEWATRKHDNTERVALDTATLSAQADILETASQTLKQAHKQGLDAQKMGVVMLQKAKQRAETIEANARAHAQIVKDEARRLHEEKIRLTEWADTLKNSAKKIAENTAHMVEIVVPSEPPPARIQVAPQANERPKDATPWTGGTPGPGSW